MAFQKTNDGWSECQFPTPKLSLGLVENLWKVKEEHQIKNIIFQFPSLVEVEPDLQDLKINKRASLQMPRFGCVNSTETRNTPKQNFRHYKKEIHFLSDTKEKVAFPSLKKKNVDNDNILNLGIDRD